MYISNIIVHYIYFPQDPVGLEPGDTSDAVIVTAKTHCHVLTLNKNELNEIMTNLSSESKCTCMYMWLYYINLFYYYYYC